MKTHQLTLTDQQLVVIHEALMMVPFGRAAPVVAAINAQLQKAEEPAPEWRSHADDFGGTD